MRLSRRVFCEALGWHTPGQVFLQHMGISLSSDCARCGRRILQDSQGNWFSFEPASISEGGKGSGSGTTHPEVAA